MRRFMVHFGRSTTRWSKTSRSQKSRLNSNARLRAYDAMRQNGEVNCRHRPDIIGRHRLTSRLSCAALASSRRRFKAKRLANSRERRLPPVPLPRGAGAGTGGKDVADCGKSHTRSATTRHRYTAGFPRMPAL